jgi:hypothetical protein
VIIQEIRGSVRILIGKCHYRVVNIPDSVVMTDTHQV